MKEGVIGHFIDSSFHSLSKSIDNQIEQTLIGSEADTKPFFFKLQKDNFQ